MTKIDTRDWKPFKIGGFTNKWTKERMEVSEILLPEKNGEPDFDFMEHFMTALQARVKRTVDLLSEIRAF